MLVFSAASLRTEKYTRWKERGRRGRGAEKGEGVEESDYQEERRVRRKGQKETQKAD